MTAPTEASRPSIASPQQAQSCVRDYLKAMEARRLDDAQRFLAAGARIVFPGGHRYATVADIVAGSRGRYRRVGKHLDPMEVYPMDANRWLVISTGTLHGEWPDGEPFDGIRFIDRFEVGGAGIEVQQVWNDLGEARLART